MVDKVYIGIIAVLVLIVIYLFAQSNQNLQDISGQQAAANAVKDIYDLQYETNSEVLSTVEMNGVYKVVVRFADFSGQRVTQDVYITKDGRLLTDRFIVTADYRTALQNQKTFIECLSGANLRILGQSNDTATLQQFNVLGTYSYKLFVSCDAANEQSCRDLGVARYPTTIYNNTGYANIYAPAFFSQLTGCTPA
ncbi:MAG: hypothetical protein QT00_C0001G0155 [archaeon GW2011_AR5]|nr:MAG: hypothetical protein QT00_C0001G0155 [archaeon GW2011_AR5]MBS3051174.1 hypothetical protein [Candidatus Aenigmarchaeota archaeon]